MALAINELTDLVIKCAIAVHDTLGPGLLESVYVECLVIELQSQGLSVEIERQVPIVYRAQKIRQRLRVDLIVDGRLIVEIKAVERLHPVHQAQVITYLKLTGCCATRKTIQDDVSSFSNPRVNGSPASWSPGLLRTVTPP